MKHLFAFMFILISAFSQERKNIGVLEFSAIHEVASSEAHAIGTLFQNYLAQKQAYNVLDRANMNTILTEQSFQQLGCTDADCAVTIGRILSIEFMVVGEISKLGESYFLTVSIISVEEGRVEHSANSKFSSLDAADVAIKKIVDELVATETTGVFPVAASTAIDDLIQQASFDVKSYHKKFVGWYLGGIIIYGVPIAYFSKPSPPIKAYAAVSPGSHPQYIYLYQQFARKKNIRWSWAGFGTLIGLTIISTL